VVSIDEYVDHMMKTGKSREGTAVITFDDAYASYNDIAIPILNSLDMPSALFICTGVIGRSNEWDDPDKRWPVMNEEVIKLLSQNGLVTIGAHTETHRSLTSLGEKDLKDEMNIPKEKLETLTGKPVNYLAYPYGQFYLNINGDVVKAAQDAGYKAAFSTNFGSSNTAANRFALNRVDVTGADDMDTFMKKLRPYNYYYVKQRVKNIYSSIRTK
jgi:peptidoglycan/xylan/chitin deacetylase (PgdA/CDA1 family)